MKNDLPPACEFPISLTINCESTWPGLIECDNFDSFSAGLHALYIPNYFSNYVAKLSVQLIFFS